MSYFLKKLCLLMLFSLPLQSQDLGMHGHTFYVEEESLLDHLQSKLKLFTLEEMEALTIKIRRHYLNLIEEPTSVEGLENAKVYAVDYFDPTVCVSKDITDHLGKIIICKGTKVNPLMIFNLNEELLFFDGMNQAHLEWARKQPPNAKWILIRGRPLDLQKSEQRPVYFDQFGAISARLKITKVPTKISQEGLKLKIENFPVETQCVSY